MNEAEIPGQYRKLVGYPFKYPYLVGISTESGILGTGILISARLVLTCGHVLHDSSSAEVIFRDGHTTARVQKLDDSLDLALLELTRPISASKVKFMDFPVQPGATLLAVGVQETPGQPGELSVAEIELKYRNKNDADGKILDIQLEGGARPGYSGGPVVAEESGYFRCVGVMRFGGHGASSSNAIGLASIQAFLADYIPDMPDDQLGTKMKGIRRLLIFTAIVFGVFVIGAIAEWRYMASHSPKVTGATVGTPEPKRTEAGQSVSGTNTVTGPAKGSSAQNPPGLNVGDHGNPDVTVWVNTTSHVYHCPGSQSYGKTMQGKYMSQAEAQREANRAAYRKVCK